MVCLHCVDGRTKNSYVLAGMCVKMLSFCNEEFVDTACMESETTAFWIDDQCPNVSVDALFQGGICDPPVDDLFATSSISGLRKNKRKPVVSVGVGTVTRPGSATAPLGMGSIQNDLSMAQSPSLKIPHVTHFENGGRHPHHNILCSEKVGVTGSRCSINKKNRYRSWVYHKIMHRSGNNLGGVVLHHRVPTCPRLKSHKDTQSGLGSSTRQKQLPVTVFHHSNYYHSSNGRCVNALLPAASYSSPPVSTDAAKTRSLIQSYVGDVLCSSRWGKSMLVRPAHQSYSLGAKYACHTSIAFF